MVKFVLEISEKEKKALEKSGKEVKNFFKRIKGVFKVKVVNEKKNNNSTPNFP